MFDPKRLRTDYQTGSGRLPLDLVSSGVAVAASSPVTSIGTRGWKQCLVLSVRDTGGITYSETTDHGNIVTHRVRAGRSVFDLSVSGWPGAPEPVGGRGKTKTRRQDGGPGARPQNADRPSARGV